MKNEPKNNVWLNLLLIHSCNSGQAKTRIWKNATQKVSNRKNVANPHLYLPAKCQNKQSTYHLTLFPNLSQTKLQCCKNVDRKV